MEGPKSVSEKGQSISVNIQVGLKRADYCDEISKALKRELGGSHRATKMVMRWTGANERTAKNWLSGQHGPSGENLIVLLRHSEEVLKTVLLLAGHDRLLASKDLIAAKSSLQAALTAIDALIDENSA